MKLSDRELNKAVAVLGKLKGMDKATERDFWVHLERANRPKYAHKINSVSEDRKAWLIRSNNALEIAREFPQLTIPEIVALREYSSGGSSVNRGLFELNAERIKPVAAYIRVLSSALCKLKAFDGMAYRTKKISRSFSQQRYRPGTIVQEPGFISAAHSGFWNHANYSGETTLFYIKSKTGRILSSLSTHGKEREVLFDRGLSFKVINAQMNKGDPFLSTCFEVNLQEL